MTYRYEAVDGVPVEADAATVSLSPVVPAAAATPRRLDVFGWLPPARQRTLGGEVTEERVR